MRLFNVSSNQAGAPFTGIHTIGCYMEDNDYLGDLTNSAPARITSKAWILTSTNTTAAGASRRNFPDGTYAYFVSISTNGTPVFPYNIGRGFYGSPTGGVVTAITETVATNFLGNTNLAGKLNPPGVNNGTVTLSWSAIEGGSYQVEATTNLADSSAWTVLGTGVSPNQTLGGYTNVTSLPDRFYRVGRTSVANFDSPGTTLFATNSVAPGGSAYRGQTVNLTITLTSPPNLPPAGAPVTSVTVGGITNISATCTASGTVVSLFTIPSGTTATNAQNVVVTFGIPPGQSQAPTFTLTGGFTINP